MIRRLHNHKTEIAKAFCSHNDHTSACWFFMSLLTVTDDLRLLMMKAPFKKTQNCQHMWKKREEGAAERKNLTRERL